MPSSLRHTLGGLLLTTLGLAAVFCPLPAQAQSSYTGFGEITLTIDTPGTATLNYTTYLPNFIRTENLAGNATSSFDESGSTTATSVTAHAGISGTAGAFGHVDNSDATDGYADITITNTSGSAATVEGNFTITYDLTASITDPGFDFSYVLAGAYIYLYDAVETTFYDGAYGVVYGAVGGSPLTDTVNKPFSLVVPGNSTLFILFYPFALGQADAAAVPEPGALAWLLVGGLGGGLLLRRRNGRRQ